MLRPLQSGSAGLPKKITLQSVDTEQPFFSDLVFLILLIRASIDAQGRLSIRLCKTSKENCATLCRAWVAIFFAESQVSYSAHVSINFSSQLDRISSERHSWLDCTVLNNIWGCFWNRVCLIFFSSLVVVSRRKFRALEEDMEPWTSETRTMFSWASLAAGSRKLTRPNRVASNGSFFFQSSRRPKFSPNVQQRGSSSSHGRFRGGIIIFLAFDDECWLASRPWSRLHIDARGRRTCPISQHV